MQERHGCKHTLYHTDPDSTWSQDLVVPDRIVCSECGRFYGYLAESRGEEVKQAKPHRKAPERVTGSSSLFRPPQAQPPAVVLAVTAAPRDLARRGIDFAELRRRVGISQVLAHIEWQPVARNGMQLRGACPVHKSTNPRSRSFSVNVQTNAYQCFSCGSKGNQLDLWAELTGLPLHAAARNLCKSLGIEPPTT